MMDDTTDDTTQPPLPSRATRIISKRSKASSRGAITASPPALGGRDRIIQFESKLEQRVLFLLLARRDLWDIWDQPPAISYTAPDGRTRHHTFDFLVTFTTGRRWAVVVKPLVRAAQSEFQKELAAIRAGLRKNYADELRLITDAHFTRDEALNAERLHQFRRNLSPEDLATIYGRFATAAFPTTVGDLVAHLAMGGVGFQAILLAIYDGRLNAETSAEIIESTRLSLSTEGGDRA